MGRLVKLTSGEPFLDRVQDQLIAVVNPALGRVDQVRDTKLKTISLTLADDWIAPTLLNSWVNYGSPFSPAGYRKRNGRIEVRGLVKDGTISGSLPVFILPAAYRSTYSRHIAVASAGAFGFMQIKMENPYEGYVLPQGGGSTWFEMSARIEAVDPSPVPNPIFPITIPHELSTPPVGVFAADATDTVSGAHVSTTVSWHVAGSNIVIDDLPELFALRSYRVTFLIVG
jgi:hypothetical protein